MLVVSVKRLDHGVYQGSLSLHIFKIEVPATNSSFVFILYRINTMMSWAYYQIIYLDNRIRYFESKWHNSGTQLSSCSKKLDTVVVTCDNSSIFPSGIFFCASISSSFLYE